MSATRVSRYPSRSKTRRAAASSSSRVRTPLAVTRSSWPARRAAAVPAGVQPPRVRGVFAVRPRVAPAWRSRCDRLGLYFDIDVEYNRSRGRPRARRGGGMTTRPSPSALVILTGAMVAALATGSHAGSKIQNGTLLHLADGDVQGHTNGHTREFLGIPYAAPPIGGLRWRPPVPAIPWQKVLEASAFRSA